MNKHTKEDVIEEELDITEEVQAEDAQQAEIHQEEEADNSKAKLLSSLINEDEDKEPELKHWKDVMQAMSIDGLWFRRQLGVIALILFGLILYVTNRYQAQQEMIEEENLRKELQDKKFRSMTRNSELTFRCRQSQLEKQLKEMGDSTLLPSNEPVYKLINKD